MKRRLALALLLLLLPLPGWAKSAPAYTISKRALHTAYTSPTLTYRMETATVNGTSCYLTQVWMADPARQIRKAISPWRQGLAKAETLGQKIKDAALVINGSGYVSPQYPEIPDNYPGTSADYFYTPLGSLTVVDGQVYRNLPGVPYYGLTLEEDGLHLYAGADNEEVLARKPLQTWSFYEGCPLAMDGQELLDHTWPFALRRATRTILAKLPQENTYLIFVARSMTLVDANAFLMAEYQPEWIYNLDGGPSTALLRRKQGKRALKLIFGGGQKIVDVMGFVE